MAGNSGDTRMKTVFVVLEQTWRGTHISSVFENEQEATTYMYELRGEGYDFDNSYQYYLQEWEVK